MRLLILLLLVAKASLCAAYDVTNENLTNYKVLFETRDYFSPSIEQNLLPSNVNTAVVSYNDSTYMVWVNRDRQPMIVKITGENVEIARIEMSDDYKVLDDVHHSFSLGIDKNGYIHVVGDMHNFSKLSSANEPIFTDASAMYWVSESPEQINSFQFLGGHPSRNLPLGGYTYCQFYNDLNSKLYLMCRIEISTGFFPGIRGLGLASYDTDARLWTAHGSKPADPRAGVKTILWEDNGSWSDRYPTPAYQGYQATLVFDSNNHMHLASTINNNNLAKGATHVVYAKSEDGGHSFVRASGTPIGNLPMRVDDLHDSSGISRQADIVMESPSIYEHIWNFAGVFLNSDEEPSVAYWPNAMYPNGWTVINSWEPQLQSWSNSYDQPTSGGAQTLNAVSPEGILTFVSPNDYGEIVRTAHLPNQSEPFKRYWLHMRLLNMDRLALRDQGIFRFMALDKSQSSLKLVQFEFKGSAGFTQEIWQNVPGESLQDIPAIPGFPDRPDITQTINGDLQTASHSGDFYASRIRGFVIPPVSGNYNFWLAGDNNCELWLSDSASMFGAKSIAKVPGWTAPGQWNKFSEQASQTIELKAGRRYYFEVIHKEGGGGDHVGVGWQLPGEQTIQVIEKEYLMPWNGQSQGVFK